MGFEAMEIFERQSHPIFAKDAAKYLTTCLHGDSQRTGPFQINEQLYMSVNSRNNVVLVTNLRTSLDLVMSDIHFAKQIIVEKIPSAVTLDH